MPVMPPQTFVSPLLFRKSFDVWILPFFFLFRQDGGKKALVLSRRNHSLLPQCNFFPLFSVLPQFLLLISPCSSLPECSAFAASVNLNNLINNSEQQEHQEAGYSKPLNLVVLRGSLLPASHSTNISVYNNNHSP